MKNSGKNIIFTGYSLSGGIAAIVGLFFDKPTNIFNPASFLAATTIQNASDLQAWLMKQPSSSLPDIDLAGYTATEEVLLTAKPRVAEALAAIYAGASVMGSIPAVGKILSSPVHKAALDILKAKVPVLKPRKHDIRVPRSSKVRRFAQRGSTLCTFSPSRSTPLAMARATTCSCSRRSLAHCVTTSQNR